MTRKLALALCSAAVFVAMWPIGARATINAHKTTYLTFNHPVRLPGVALGSGTYIFEIANPDTSGNIVRVLSRDRQRSYFMGFTQTVVRPNGMPRTQVVSLAESAAGMAPPLTVWWPDHESQGRQFVYPEGR